MSNEYCKRRQELFDTCAKFMLSNPNKHVVSLNDRFGPIDVNPYNMNGSVSVIGFLLGKKWSLDLEEMSPEWILTNVLNIHGELSEMVVKFENIFTTDKSEWRQAMIDLADEYFVEKDVFGIHQLSLFR